ncbi:MAG: dienelactone hydrolase family protein [Methylobacteriaceae bacterium]|nr:dienelactone hydrolase family protein [Methylobacteriaceae bacterium]
MTSPLNGPRLPARSGKARQLVVFLHGYGADGNDLIDLGRQWQAVMPDAAFVSPHAPEPCGMSPMGRQWFGLTMRDPDERWRGVVKARPVLDAFLDAELAALGVDESQLALVGFSQGTMMALHVGLRRPRAPAAIVGYSGTLVGPEHLAEATARTAQGGPPRVLLAHGDQDEMIPVDALFQACEDLAKANIPAEFHLSLGVGHGIDGGGLTHGALFVAAGFGVRVKRRGR